jgi:RNA polymerase sigma-70 factor (ECF subfamily)
MSTLFLDAPASGRGSDSTPAPPADRLDEVADAMLMLRHYQRLLHCVRKRFPPTLRTAGIDVEDVVQDTFARAWMYLPGFEFRGEDSFFRWIRRIARMHIINLLECMGAKKRGGGCRAGPNLSERFDRADRVVGFLLSASKSPRSVAGDREMIALVRDLLPRLSGVQHQAIQLRYIQGLSLAETGAAMGRSEAAAAMLCFRALRVLRVLLSQSGAS